MMLSTIYCFDQMPVGEMSVARRGLVPPDRALEAVGTDWNDWMLIGQNSIGRPDTDHCKEAHLTGRSNGLDTSRYSPI